MNNSNGSLTFIRVWVINVTSNESNTVVQVLSGDLTEALCDLHVGVRRSIRVSQKYYLKRSKEGADV